MGITAYLSFFRIRFINGLQYRAAAFAGVATQFSFGFMFMLMYYAFYQTGNNNLPMPFPQLASYLWLQQAFLALFMSWFYDDDIFNCITDGSVAYELCRPADLYTMWFIKNIAVRVARAVLRCMPIIMVAVFLPKPFRLLPPVSLLAGVLFLISMVLGMLVLISYNMLIYISAFYTISPMGVRILSVSFVEFFSGAIIPLPLLPDNIRVVFELLPFGSIQNTPFLIYNGTIPVESSAPTIMLQLFWFVVMLMIGRVLMNKALTKVIVQGG